jgi:phosphoglycolate phosphatase
VSGATTVVLDRDGTLLDFYDMFHRFVVDLHDDAGVPPPARAEILSHAYWTSITSGALYIGQVRVRDRVHEVIRQYMPLGTLYEGTARTLTALRDAGTRLLLVSSWIGTEQTWELLRRHRVAECFDTVMTRDDLPGVPDDTLDTEVKEALARRALSLVGHGGGDRLFVVGDTPADVTLGRRLNATVVGVRTGNGGMLPSAPPDGPDVLLSSAAELGSLILDVPTEAAAVLADPQSRP